MVGGIKYINSNRFVIDLYFGGTINQSFISKIGNSNNRYDQHYLRPGFSGIAPVINCTFGFKF